MAVTINDTEIAQVLTTKFLGVHILHCVHLPIAYYSMLKEHRPTTGVIWWRRDVAEVLWDTAKCTSMALLNVTLFLTILTPFLPLSHFVTHLGTSPKEAYVTLWNPQK